MTDSFQEHGLFWALWLITAVVCAQQTIYVLRSKLDIIGFVPVITTMIGYFYVVQAAIVVSTMGHKVAPNVFIYGQLSVLGSLAGLLLGWYRGRGKDVKIVTPVNDPKRNKLLWTYGCVAICVGILVHYYFYVLLGADYKNNTAYVYLMIHIAFPGIAVCVYVASSDPEYRRCDSLLWLMGLILVFIFPWVSGVRRGPSFTFLITLLYGFYVARPRAINRGVIFGGLLAAGVMMLFFFTIRDYDRGSWRESRLERAKFDKVLFGKAYEEDDNEFLYCCCCIATAVELDRYQWGTGYLSLIPHLIPRQLWEDKPSIGKGGLFEPINWFEMREVTGIMPSNGSTFTGIGESFLEFGWLVAGFWYAVGFAMGRLFKFAMAHPDTPAPVIYVLMIGSTHYLISQGVAMWFVPGMIYIAVPIGIYVMAGRTPHRSAAPRRRAKADASPVLVS